MDRTPTVVIVGAGAAGIFASLRASELGARVILLEKNDRIGIKILISGGGKCNITHEGPMKDLLHAFRTNEANFLRPSCYKFTNSIVMELFTKRGLELMVRPDGRVFPLHGNAKDVVTILSDCLAEAGVRVNLNTPVAELKIEDGMVTGVFTEHQFIPAASVILAVGGSSYPGTGTTGDGYPWAKEAGHTILKVRAALAPIFTDPTPAEGWAGIALRDCILKARQNGKELVRWRGDLLYTHRGISGPCALGISREVAENQQHGTIMLEVDVVPDQSYEIMSSSLRNWCEKNPRRQVDYFLGEFLPHRTVSEALVRAGVLPDTKGAYLPQKQRNRLIENLKAWQLGRAEHVPLEKGEVVAGGVSLAEVDPKTMRSNKCQNLYLCGEILDIAGPVGGYNLQAAFSTGFVAGENAAMSCFENTSKS